MKTVQISPDLKLPLDTVVQRKTIVAKNRVGKSNTACVYVEEVHKAGVQTIVLDPKGDWYGIRSSFDGKGPGLEFLVMGGDFGDVPLAPNAGTALGEYLGANHVNVVLDVSDFALKDLATFGADFFEALYVARKKNRTPLDLVIEEAEDFAPQQIFDKTYSIQQSRCLGALIKIAKKAGFLGIGLLLIAQRTASLNKNVLSQSDGLFIMRTTAPQDLKAIDLWLGDRSQEERDYVKKNIQGLPTGTAIVWFPELGIFKQTQVRRRETFDAGYTPKVGETKVEPKVRAKVDLERIMGNLGKVVEEAKANDPAALKAEIQRLQKREKGLLIELEGAKQALEFPPEETVVEVEKPVPFIPRELREPAMLAANTIAEAAETIRKAFAVAEKMVTQLPTLNGATVTLRSGRALVGGKPVRTKPAAIKVPPGKSFTLSRLAEKTDSELNGPMQRILDAIAWFEAVGIPAPRKEAVAFKAGYRPGGGAFQNPLGALRNEKGNNPWPPLIQYGQGTVSLTQDGRSRTSVPDIGGDAEELQQAVLEACDGPMARILQVVIEAHPNAISKEELAAKAGYAEGGGAFQNPLGRLRTCSLIDYPQKGMVKAEPFLFLET